MKKRFENWSVVALVRAIHHILKMLIFVGKFFKFAAVQVHSSTCIANFIYNSSPTASSE